MTVHDEFSLINDCRELEYSLWLKHTDKYNYINAYNLGYLSKLSYSKVIFRILLIMHESHFGIVKSRIGTR